MSETSPESDQSRRLAPYQEQRPFLEDEKRFYAFVSGLGAGKTVAGIFRAIKNAKHWNTGHTGLIVAPTGSAIRDIILPEMTQLGILENWEYKGKASDQPGLHLPNGTRIILEGADNRRKIERLRGLNLSWYWVDEAAIIDPIIWDILPGRLRTGNYRNGFITTTPKGKNWVWERFVDIDGQAYSYGDANIYESDDAVSILGVPSHANPYSPDDYKENLDSEYDGAFYRQEVLGEFTQFDGLVYPWFGDKNLLDDHPEDYDDVIYGVDWGYNNPSVIVAIARDGNERIIVDEWYERRCTVDDHLTAAEKLQERWGPGMFYCDPAEPSNIEAFKRAGLDAREAKNDVTPGIQHVTSMQNRIKVVKSCQSVRNEFGQYQYDEGRDDDKPISQNDHAMDAIRYALFTAQDGGMAVGSISVADDEPDPPDGLPGLGQR